MICPKCSKSMRVVNTRSPDRGRDNPAVQYFLNDGYKVFGWWCHDFEMRLRRCARCGMQLKTIEVIVTDLRDAFDDIEDHRPLGRPWKPQKGVLPQLDDADKPRFDDNWRTQSNLCGG